MAWTTPRDWTTGELVTEAMMDTQIKGNMDYLKTKADAYDTHDGQDAVTAHGSAGAHSYGDHTDVVREVWLPANPATEGSFQQGAVGPAVRLEDSVTDTADFNLFCPSDFVSFSSCKAVFKGTAAGNIYWKIIAYYAAHDEAYNNHSDTPAYGTGAITASGDICVLTPANPLTMSSLATGDYIGLQLSRDASDSSDTLGTYVLCYGLIFSYTARQ